MAFSWTKNGLLLQNSEYLYITNSRKGSMLSLDRVVQNDAGNYTCVANNDLSEDRTSAQLIVHGKGKSK